MYSDTVGIWHELPELGVDEDHCAISPLGDTSAIVAYAGVSGLEWAMAEGSRWTQRGNLDARRFQAAHPRFRFRPSGGLWLLWTERRRVHMSCYRDGEWFRGDSLTAIHPAGQTFVAGWGDLTHDDGERPVVAWGDLGFGTTFRDVGVVAFPTETGWAPGEEIPGSDNVFLTPYVARDMNGDLWAAWRTRTFVNRWTHTYVKATSSAPVLIGAGPARTISWTLSESAPESWWAVLRARNDAPFEQVARVQAGLATDMSWNDASPPAGVLRYRIRRESLDARYHWESEDGLWPPKSERALKLAHAAGASLAAGHLELTGADAGTFKLAVYDIQGRLVLQREARAEGTGRDTVRLDFGEQARGLPNGIYFASVRDASGRATNPLKLVLLR